MDSSPEPTGAPFRALHACPDDHISQWANNTKTFALQLPELDGRAVFGDSISVSATAFPLDHAGKTLEFELRYETSDLPDEQWEDVFARIRQ